MTTQRWLPATLAMVLCTACSTATRPAAGPPARAARPTGTQPVAAPPPRATAATDDLGDDPSDADPDRAAGRDFSIPVPPGFVSITDERAPVAMRKEVRSVLRAGGVVLVVVKSHSAWFRGSIVAVPAAGDVPTDASCRAHSAGLAASLNNTLLEAKVVAPGSCRWSLQDKERAHRRAFGAVMKSPSSHWVVTCNFDARDEGAQAGCMQVLEDWRTEQ